MHPVFKAWDPREVWIGDLALGGWNPVRIQSMTNTPTMDAAATVAQCIRMIEAGCEMIRITAQNIQEAENIGLIKRELHQKGFRLPIIADVHFKPAVAERAAQIVDKVRINPGNYADKRISKTAISQKEYNEELERIAERLHPLLKICRQYGTAIRIGTNHGSLSGRIMNRYGDTHEGMAESAMEFVRICHAFGFHKLVLSMKSSNVRVMVAATRMLVCRMIQENMQYPVHLGVTEAGNGPEGRIKSACGIASLLADGIGDTVRVSLTEAPENEIPVARQIVSRFSKPPAGRLDVESEVTPCHSSRFEYERRISWPAGSIGHGNVPVVLSGRQRVHSIDEYLAEEGNAGVWDHPEEQKTDEPCIRYLNCLPHQPLPACDPIKSESVLVFSTSSVSETLAIRQKIAELDGLGQAFPVVLKYEGHEADVSRFAIDAAICLGPLLNDGLCDGVLLENSQLTSAEVNRIAFAILQATRARITQTEYIACPGCGRTQYKLEEALKKVKAATAHLKGLKIAVMGCIVNGPGEMADADYGYIGQGSGKVTLYHGRKAVKKNIPEELAVAGLIDLMKSQGDWQDP